MISPLFRCWLLAVGTIAASWSTIAAQTPDAPSKTTPAASDPFTLLAAKEPQAAAQSGVRVVVQNPDGSPAKDAVVVFTPWRDDEAAHAERSAAHAAFPAEEPRRIAAQAATGTRYRLDERGATRVPKGGSVFAFAGELVAHSDFADDSTEPRLTLELAQPYAFTVEVVAADGTAAADVPIRLRDNPRFQGDRWHQTGADGSLTIRLLKRPPPDALVLADVVSSSLVQAPPPEAGAKIRLQLPPTTAVQATFAGELPPGGELRWTLQCGENGLQIPGDATGPHAARWPFVEIGATATRIVRLGRLELAKVPFTVVADGQPVATTRTIQAPTYAVQLLGDDGQPARERLLQLEWRTRDRTHSEHLRTTRDGWIEFRLPRAFDSTTTKKVALTVDLYAGDSRDALVATAELSLSPAGNVRTVLPPLAVPALPVIAAGVVVDREGQPVRDLSLSFSVRLSQRLRTDADGRFAVRGKGTERTKLRITLDGDWALVDPPFWATDIDAGNVDVRLVVQRPARVRFGCELGGPLHSDIAYRLESATDPAVRVDFGMPWNSRELVLPAGHWHFVAHRNGEELLRLPDLRCDSGVETHDPRFMTFDWRSYATLVELSVRDATGKPTDDCTVWLHSVDSASGMSPRQGRLRLLLPKGGAHVSVAPKDPTLAKIDFGMLTENQIVVLGGGPALTVALQPMPELPPGIELVLAIDDGDGVAFDKNGMALVLAQKPGPVTPRIRVRRGTTTSAPLDWQLPEIDVPKDGKKFAVELTAERKAALATSIERAQRQ
jgi:hypothetical protein